MLLFLLLPVPVFVISNVSITRDQIMSRVQVCVDEKVPYSQTKTTDRYRQDLYHMHLAVDMLLVICKKFVLKYQKNDLKKGDVILKPDQHVLLFGGWIDSDKFYEYVEHQTGDVCRESDDVCRESYGSYNYFSTNGYFPLNIYIKYIFYIIILFFHTLC
jgi:hypothetical protein